MIKRKYYQYIEFAAKHPIVLILLTILFLVFSYPILHLKMNFDNNGEGWYSKNSERFQLKKQFVKDFGSDEMMMYLLTFPDTILKERRLEYVKNLTDSINSSIYNFESVFSTCNISEFEGQLGSKYASKMEKIYFQSKDSLCEMIFLKVRLNKNILKERPVIIDSLKRVSEAILPKYIRRDLTGQSIIDSELDRLSSEDSVKLFVICFILVCGLLFWQVKKFSYIVLSLFMLMIAVIPSLSLFGWLNVPVNMITITIPLLFLINFSSFAIHIITKQSIDTHSYLNKKIPPIITSALATIIGFGSLITNNIHIIEQYGILTSTGIFVGLLTYLFIAVPLVIRFIKVNDLVLKENWLNRLLDRYYLKINKTNSYWIAGILFVVLVSSLIVCFTIKADTNLLNVMKKSNTQRQTALYVEKHFGSVEIIDFYVIKKNHEKLNKEDFKAMVDIDKQIASVPLVKSVVDYDLWKPVINLVSIFDPRKAKQLKAGFITKDENRSHIMVIIPTVSIKETDNILQSILATIDAKVKNSRLEIKPVGFLPLFIEQINSVVKGMIYGLLLAIVLIQIVITIMVRDIKLGFLTLLATVFPLSAIA